MDRVTDLSQDMQNLMNVRLKWIIIQLHKILARDCIGDSRHDIISINKIFANTPEMGIQAYMN